MQIIATVVILIKFLVAVIYKPNRRRSLEHWLFNFN